MWLRVSYLAFQSLSCGPYKMGLLWASKQLVHVKSLHQGDWLLLGWLFQPLPSCRLYSITNIPGFKPERHFLPCSAHPFTSQSRLVPFSFEKPLLTRRMNKEIFLWTCDTQVSTNFSVQTVHACYVTSSVKISVEDMQILEKLDLNIRRLHKAA